jgi:beta-xylosidase
VLHADYSDPDVIRVGSEYWMTASSFTATPGLPLLRSSDLVNWELVGHALRQVPHPSYAEVRPGCGVWAPSIRHHAGLFWIFFPMPDEGIYVTTAGHPLGDWCEPWLLQAAKGWIDPCPFWDDDGTAWLFHAYANSRSGKRDRLHARPMSPDGRRLLGEGVEIAHAPHHPYLEGPKLHKRDGWYYVMAPGGGVPTGWQVAYRSRCVTGPYEEKIVLETGSTTINGPHQGAFIDTPAGDWWFIHFQDLGPFGRVTHLQPVVWPSGDEWPRVGIDYDQNGVGEPVPHAANSLLRLNGPRCAPATSDEFDAPRLGPQWQWQANHQPDWADLASRPGWLRLAARPPHPVKLHLTPHLLLQKFPARSFAVSTVVEVAGDSASANETQAGLVVVGGDASACLVVCTSLHTRRLRYRIGKQLVADAPVHDGPVELTARVFPDGSCAFGYVSPDGPVDLAVRFPVSEGGWMGAKIGLFAAGWSGHADFDHLRFTP